MFVSKSGFIHQPTLCAICITDFDRGVVNNCMKLKCGHIYHKACVEKWVELKEKCPSCKARAIIPIPESLKVIYEKTKRVFFLTLNLVKIGLGYIYIPLLTQAVCHFSYRFFKGLPFLLTKEENELAYQIAHQHNLKYGYKTRVITISQLLVYPIATAGLLALGYSSYFFIKSYLRNRVIIDSQSAKDIQYIPPIEKS
ncbi:MAG: E3 ubiquitin protein ligase [Parachlamydiaceae bacterium]|nr:E3 ubiquitin protein ligase [Parachlamydiaceae bacterium]